MYISQSAQEYSCDYILSLYKVCDSGILLFCRVEINKSRLFIYDVSEIWFSVVAKIQHKSSTLAIRKTLERCCFFSACRYEFDSLPWAAPISTRAISKTKDMVIICSKYPVTPLLPLLAVCTLYPMMRSQKLRDEASPVAIKCCLNDLLPCSSCNWNL